jgi:hypothetical protein
VDSVDGILFVGTVNVHSQQNRVCVPCEVLIVAIIKIVDYVPCEVSIVAIIKIVDSVDGIKFIGTVNVHPQQNRVSVPCEVLIVAIITIVD